MKLSEEQCVAVGNEIFDLSMESSIEKLSTASTFRLPRKVLCHRGDFNG